LLAYRAPQPLPLRQLIPDQLTLPLQSPSGHARVPLVAPGDAVAIGDPLLMAEAGSLEVDLFSPVRATVMSLDSEEGLRLQVR
jgi:Na+-translocating ferredoxin:NAD+ oxidoreductase RnfC subunit